MASPETIDQKTNRSYLESGLQPSVGGITQVRNVQVSHTHNPQERRGGNKIRNVTNKTMGLAGFADSHTSRRPIKSSVKRSKEGDEDELIKQAIEAIQTDAKIAKYSQQIAERLESLRDVDFDEESFEELLNQLPPGVQEALRRRGIIGKIFLLLAYRKAFRLNLFIWSWGGFLWKFLQLPLALLGLVALLLAIAIEATINQLTEAKPDDGFFASALKTIGKAVLEVGEKLADFANTYILNYFGLDLALLNPLNIFLALHMIMMGYAIILLFAIFLIYKLGFLNPILGSGGGMKIGAFLLALVGYSVPILNLFPWFIPWTATVLLHPK